MDSTYCSWIVIDDTTLIDAVVSPVASDCVDTHQSAVAPTVVGRTR